MRDESPGEPEAMSDEKEDQDRDSRLIGEREGNKEHSCEEGKQNTDLSRRPTEEISFRVRLNEDPKWK